MANLLNPRTVCVAAVFRRQVSRVIVFVAAGLVLLGGPLAARAAEGAADKPLWRDADKPMDQRVQDLIGQLTLAEKASLLDSAQPAIPRLGIPAYAFWSECLHGVARNGTATVFPQAIGMAAMWDPPMQHQIADTIATEGRAKHREYAEAHNGDSAQNAGLNFWTPNINIFRDPRWGRGQETYGEDPFLTGRLAVAFIQGLQGDDPKYLKTMACAKHFAVHSGPENSRHRFNVLPSERDLYETYLPQFEAAVREGHVGAVMGAYNRLNGVPATSSKFLLTELLRQKWGFTGHVVSDCGAINDIFKYHGFANEFPEAEALSLKAGCDLACWGDPASIQKAVSAGLMTEADMNVSLARVLKARFQLGLFDPPERVSYARIPVTENNTPEHAKLALRAARESVVLLKNNGVLPLDRAKVTSIGVIGVNAASIPMLLGNYNGTPSDPVTILQGIANAAGSKVHIYFAPGCPLAVRVGDTNGPARALAVSNAITLAKSSDVVIYVGGLSPQLEGEEMEVKYEGFGGGDRTRIELPSVQTELLKALHETGKPLVFVNCSGSAVAMPWEAENVPAIVQAWYPGQAGGTAVAEILFGDVNPAGRLPVTFYRATEDLPPFMSYAMSNRTYRYFAGKPLYAFGHGLSYTKFDYKSVACDKAQAAPADTLRVSLDLANTGAKSGEEVVQVYFRHVDSAVPQPREALCGFRRVNVEPGKSARVEIEVPVNQFRQWDAANGQYIVESGKYEILVGASSEDIRGKIPLTVVASK